jgi:hypothetical protein
MVPGTLGGTVVSASPLRERLYVPRAGEPPTMPAPWAWYRSDDVEHVGGDVSGWPDRAGDRDMVLSITARDYVPLLAGDVLDGHPAVIGPPGSTAATMHALQADYDAHAFPDGVTMLAVMRSVEYNGAQSILGFGSTTGLELYYEDAAPAYNYLEFAAWGVSGTPYLEYLDVDPVPFGPDWLAVLGRAGPDVVDVAINGQPITDTPEWHVTPDAAAWSGAEASWTLVQPQRDDGSGFAEYVLWDRLLDAGEQASVWGYLAARYPSLGIS